MNNAERVAVTVEAARQHQKHLGQAASQKQTQSTRQAIIITVGVLALAFASVVALAFKAS